jgi:transcriptional regulator with XRE-family HTH domain
MFFDNFLALCELKKVAPTKAVIDAGLPKSSWSYWKKKYEQGEDPKPSSDNTSKLANYFSVTVDYLLTGEAPEQKEKPTPSEESELNAHAKAILYKYEQLDPAQRVMFEKMLDAALEAAKGDKNEKG